LVFVTKYRHGALTDPVLVRCEEVMRQVCADFEAELREFDGEDDHVHLLVHYPPKVQLSKLVNSLKGVSSRLLRKEYGEHVNRYPWGGRLWSGSYFAGSVGGAPISVLRQYIEDQKRPG
jgi:putative transposase